ncbi:hypothetical protein [Lentibacillus jeotgali]|nr:hypothetical protein [Lentibacillus jeotgali]
MERQWRGLPGGTQKEQSVKENADADKSPNKDNKPLQEGETC